jgi:hypothetical protein
MLSHINRPLLFTLAFLMPLCSVLVLADTQNYDTLALGNDAEPFRSQFNEEIGKVRLVLLASPTCGACLRGVDLIYKKVVKKIDNSDLKIFVVWSSQLGAKAKHVPDATKLMPDPRAQHLWDGDKQIGIAYQGFLGLVEPAWDIWMIFDRYSRWDGPELPLPTWWEHQLQELPQEKRLDPKRFANRLAEFLAQ